MGQVLACCCSHLMMHAWSNEWPYLDLTCSESHTSEFQEQAQMQGKGICTGCLIKLPLRAQQNSAGTSVHASEWAGSGALCFSSATFSARARVCAACDSCSALLRLCSFLSRRAATSSTENVAPLESTTTLRRACIEGSDPNASTTMPCPMEEGGATAATAGGSLGSPPLQIAAGGIALAGVEEPDSAAFPVPTEVSLTQTGGRGSMGSATGCAC